MFTAQGQVLHAIEVAHAGVHAAICTGPASQNKYFYSGHSKIANWVSIISIFLAIISI